MATDRRAGGPTTFAPWIKYFPGPDGKHRGATVVFPHAGGSAAGYRKLGRAFSDVRDTYIVQYPRRAERLRHPAPKTVDGLARDLFDAGPWRQVAPLRLFGHSMGALVAFEFARIAEASGVAVRRLWVSAGPVPSSVASMPNLPTGDAAMLADLADLGGTDPRLLTDPEFTELLTIATRADYEAFNRYHCSPGVRIHADIDVICGHDDHRVDIASLRRWGEHTEGAFRLSFLDGGHFYVNEHIKTLANRINTATNRIGIDVG